MAGPPYIPPPFRSPRAHAPRRRAEPRGAPSRRPAHARPMVGPQGSAPRQTEAITRSAAQHTQGVKIAASGASAHDTHDFGERTYGEACRHALERAVFLPFRARDDIRARTPRPCPRTPRRGVNRSAGGPTPSDAPGRARAACAARATRQAIGSDRGCSCVRCTRDTMARGFANRRSIVAQDRPGQCDPSEIPNTVDQPRVDVRTRAVDPGAHGAGCACRPRYPIQARAHCSERSDTRSIRARRDLLRVCRSNS